MLTDAAVTCKFGESWVVVKSVAFWIHNVFRLTQPRAGKQKLDSEPRPCSNARQEEQLFFPRHFILKEGYDDACYFYCDIG